MLVRPIRSDIFLTGIRPYLVLSFVCALLYLPGISGIPSLDRDESRFAQSSKQMVESNNWVDIRFQKEPRYKKPVGIYWLQSLSVKLFSPHNYQAIWAYRLPSAIAAWASVLLTFALANTFFGRMTSFLSSLLFAGSFIVIIEAHQAKTDALLLSLVLLAQLILSRLYFRCSATGGRQQLNIFVATIFWSTIAAGVMIKGPILPLIIILTVLVLSVWDRKWSWSAGTRPLFGVLLFLCLVLPWFVAIWKITDGRFFQESLGHDMLSKVSTGMESHGAPPGYHLLLLLVCFWPVAFYIYPALLKAWSWRDNLGIRFCIAWVVPMWVVLELVATKLPHYTLPLYPAIAIICATGIEKGYSLRGLFGNVVISLWAMTGLAIAVVFLYVPIYLNTEITLSVLAASIILFAGVVFGLLFIYKNRYQLATLGTVILSGASLLCFVTLVLPNQEPLWLTKNITSDIRKQFGTIPQIISAGYNEPSLVFMTRTDIKFGNGADAATFLQKLKTSVAVVDERENELFLTTVRHKGIMVRKIAEAKGLNYSRGKWKNISVYVKN